MLNGLGRAAVGALMLAGTLAPPALAGQASVTIGGAGGSFKVPADVSSVEVVAIGGHGGTGSYGGAGGRGARVAGTLATAPGSTLTVQIGGGGDGGSSAGGTGGAGGAAVSVFYNGVYQLVAAGGGGSGSSVFAGAGGDAGVAGGDGRPGIGSAAHGGAPGTPGGGGAGGAGTGDSGAGSNGGAGVGGTGGAGGAIGESGGGGGGGFYGGGGGGAGAAAIDTAGGGGGGFSYVAPLSQPIVGVVGSEMAPNVTFTYEDSIAPSVTLAAPSTNARTLTGTAGIDGGDAGSVTIALAQGPGGLDASGWTVSAPVAADGSFSATLPPLADGDWTARATQTDAAGNQGASAAQTFTVDRTAPSPVLTAPAGGAMVTTATPQLTGRAGVAAGDDAAVTLTLASATSSTTLSAPIAADGKFSVTAPALADGDYALTAAQGDAAGNTGSSATITFTVDTAPARAPTATPTPALLSSPSATATPAPATGAAKVAAALRITGSSAKRKGRVVTLQLRGKAAASATGKLQLTVAGHRASATLRKGSWTVTLRLRTSAKRLKATIAYHGDAAHSPATARRLVQVAVLHR